VGPARLAVAAVAVLLAGAPATLAATQTKTAPDPAGAAEAIAAGDGHYARRGEGADERGASPFQIDGASRSTAGPSPSTRDPSTPRLRLMRAVFFRGGFCGEMPRDEKLRLFDEAKDVGEGTVAMLDAELKRRKGRSRATPPAGPRRRRGVTSGRPSRGASGPSSTGLRRAAGSGAPGRIRDLARR